MPPPLPPDPALGLAIKELRDARGLTQEELASQAKATIGTISRMESAKKRACLGDRDAGHRRDGRFPARPG